MINKALYDQEAEAYAIGSILIDPSLIAEYPLAPEDFYHKELGEIYMAIMLLFGDGKDINLYSVADNVARLYDREQKEVLETLKSLAGFIVAPVNGIVYAKRVKELSTKRKLLKSIEGAVDAINNNASVEEVNSMLERAISGIEPSVKIKSIADNFSMDRIKELKKMKVFHTHLTRLNDCIRLSKGELISIVGDTSRGKTQFTLNIVDDVIKQKGNVIYFSLDMEREQLLMRLISMHQQVPLSTLKPDNPHFEEMFRQELSNKEYYSHLYEFSGTSDIHSVIHLARSKNPDLVVLDYIQNFRDPAYTNRAQELTSIMLLLQRESHRYPIIALSQVSKGSSDVGLLERAKGSSTIGQASSVIIEVDREEDNYRYKIRKNRTWGITTGWIDLRMYYGYLTEA